MSAEAIRYEPEPVKKGMLLLHGLTSTSAMLGLFKAKIEQTTAYEPMTIGGPLEVNIWYGQKKKVRDGLKRLTDTTQEKVAVVGHSLGGMHGAEIAFEHPEEVDEVVTIFSPVRHIHGKPKEIHATAISGKDDPIVNRRIANNVRWNMNWMINTADHTSVIWRPPVQEFVIAQFRHGKN